jgi:hypothetical protein
VQQLAAGGVISTITCPQSATVTVPVLLLILHWKEPLQALPHPLRDIFPAPIAVKIKPFP